MQLTEEYEERLAAVSLLQVCLEHHQTTLCILTLLTQVQHSFDESQQEVLSLRAERDLYEENMKKAFMRGICALNLEAMSMFRQNEAELTNGDTHNSQGTSSPLPGAKHPMNAHADNTPDTGGQNLPSGINVLQYQRPPPSKMIHVTTTAGGGGQNQARSGKNVRSSRKPLQTRTPTGHKPAIVVERHIATSEQ